MITKNTTFHLFLSIVSMVLIFGTIANAATINDLSPASAQYKAVNFLVDRKIMEVDQNNNFKPSLLISKLDLAKYLYNLITYYKLESYISTGSSEEISKIQSRLSALEKQIQSNTSAQTSIQNDLSDLKKRLTALESKVASSGSSTQIPQGTQTKDVSKDIDSLSKRIATLEKDSSDTSKAIEQLTKRVTALEQKDLTTTVTNLSKNLDSLSKRVSTLEQKDVSNIVPNLSRDLDAVAKSSTALEQSLAQANGKIISLTNDVNKLFIITNDASNNIAALKTEVTSNMQRVESKISALENSLNLSQQDIGKIVTIGTQVSNLDGRVSALEQSSQQSNQRLSNVENAVSQNSKDIESLKPLNNLYFSTSKEVSTLSQRISKIEEIINKSDDFIKRLDAIDVLTVADVVGNFQVLSNRFDQLVAKYTKIEDQMRTLSTEQQYILNEISSVKDSVVKTNDLSEKVSALSIGQEKTNADIESLNKEVNDLRSELDSTRWIAIAGIVTSVVLGIILLVTAGQ